MNFNNQATKSIIPRTLAPLEGGSPRIKMNINDWSSLKKAIITGIGGSGKTTYIQDVFRTLGVEPFYIDYELFSRVIMPRYCRKNGSLEIVTGDEMRIVSVTALFLYEILVTDLEYLIDRENLYEILDMLSESLKNMQLGISSGFADYRIDSYLEQAHSLNLRWRGDVSIVIDNVKFKDEVEGEKFVTWCTNLGLKDSDRIFVLTDPKTGSLMGSMLPVYALEDLRVDEVNTLIRSGGSARDRILDLIDSMVSRLNGDPMWLLNTPEEVEVFIRVFGPEIHRDNLNHMNSEYFAERMYRGIVWTRYIKMVNAYNAVGVTVQRLADCDANFSRISDLAHLRTGDPKELYSLYLKYKSGKSLAEVQQSSSYLSAKISIQGGF